MRIGGIGYIDKDGIVQLPQEILPSLSIHNGCIMYGMYYPDDKKKYISHDFCISPIPYEFWPVTGKLIIKVQQQSKALKAICNCLYKNQINILHSSSIRTGHRYSVIDLYIAFEGLLNAKKHLTFIEDDHYFLETKNELDHIVELIESECKDFLFYDPQDLDLRQPIIGKINTALHYFYDKSRKLKEADNDAGNGRQNHKSIYNPFTLRFKEGHLVEEFSQISSNTGGKIADIIHKTFPSPSESNPSETDLNVLLPSICFVSADSHYLNLRIVIIPGNNKRNFFKVDIFYQRLKAPNTTKGLLLFLLSNFSPRYKIWKYFNQLYECRDSYGAGKLTFYMEDDHRNFENEIVLDDIEQYVKFLNSELPADLKSVTLLAKAENVYPQNANERFRSYYAKNNSKKYDIFLSYSYKNYKEADKVRSILIDAGCSVFMAQHILQAGDHPESIIKNELRDCRELCLLYSPDSEESQWVMTEWAVAWALEKKIVPILLEIHPRHIKNKRLFEVQFIKYHDEEELIKYAKEAFMRRYEFLFHTGKIF